MQITRRDYAVAVPKEPLYVMRAPEPAHGLVHARFINSLYDEDPPDVTMCMPVPDPDAALVFAAVRRRTKHAERLLWYLRLTRPEWRPREATLRALRACGAAGLESWVQGSREEGRAS